MLRLLLCAILACAACGTKSEPLAALALDAGNRWQVDEHTRLTFGRMVEACEGSVTDDAGALRARGDQLNGLITELIAGCTMTGAGHEQLHVFLNGYMPAVAALAEAGRAADLERVRDYLVLYSEYFE